MSVYDKLLWVAIVSNALLWGGVIAAFTWLGITDPTVPDDATLAIANQAQTDQQADKTNAAPRHRA